MLRSIRARLTLLTTLLALVATAQAVPAPAAAIELGAGAGVAARYTVEFVAENGSGVRGNGDIVIWTDADLSLNGGLDANVEVEADAEFSLRGLAADSRYTVVVSGVTAAGANVTDICQVETGRGGGGGGCSAIISGLAVVGGVTVHEGGAGGPLAASSRISVSTSLDLGIGLGL